MYVTKQKNFKFFAKINLDEVSTMYVGFVCDLLEVNNASLVCGLDYDRAILVLKAHWASGSCVQGQVNILRICVFKTRLLNNN